jgi:hypothetical protein
VVDYLKGNGGDLALQHNRVYRPWGWLNRGERYQVKCIIGETRREALAAKPPSPL